MPPLAFISVPTTELTSSIIREFPNYSFLVANVMLTFHLKARLQMVMVQQFVYAQHGRELKGLKSPVCEPVCPEKDR